MGRSINSFTTWSNPVNAMESKDQTPEEKLFTAVLSQAVHDAFKKFCPRKKRNERTTQQARSHVITRSLDREAAKNFFMDNGHNLKIICELAGRDSQYVHEKMKKHILRENGWNVDKSLTYLHKTYRRSYGVSANSKKRGRSKLYD